MESTGELRKVKVKKEIEQLHIGQWENHALYKRETCQNNMAIVTIRKSGLTSLKIIVFVCMMDILIECSWLEL